MLIDLSELLSTIDKELDVRADIEMSRFISKMCDYEIVKKEPVLIKLRNTGKRTFTLATEIELSLMIPCDRCLEDVKYDMNIKVNKEIDMNESENDKILVNLPMKVLCSENCKGICNRCGANLNSQTCNCDTTELDPRMSKIRDIFNNFKEV